MSTVPSMTQEPAMSAILGKTNKSHPKPLEKQSKRNVSILKRISLKKKRYKKVQRDKKKKARDLTGSLSYKAKGEAGYSGNGAQ